MLPSAVIAIPVALIMTKLLNVALDKFEPIKQPVVKPVVVCVLPKLILVLFRTISGVVILVVNVGSFFGAKSVSVKLELINLSKPSVRTILFIVRAGIFTPDVEKFIIF